MTIRVKHNQPANEQDFELLCLLLLQKYWNTPNLDFWGHRGESQEGIDILDMDSLKAAQCKLHDPRKSLTPKTIRQEVAAARSFRPALSLYVIMTTAKVSTQAQRAILTINEDHQKQGLFKVELITWQRIEVLLVQYSDVWEKLYPSDQAGSQWIEASIDEACAQLEKRNFELARLLSQKIWEQKWDKLAPRQKFRILTNIATAYVAEGNIKDAIPSFLDAKIQQPDDERAIANEIFAYILGGEDTRAFDLATEARAKHPNSASILKHWLHTTPLGSLDQLQKEVPPLLQTDPDVCLALVERATKIANFGTAERFAKLALEGREDWTQAKLVLGESITAVEELKVERKYSEPVGAGSQSRLRLAELNLTEVINKVRGTVMVGIKARALLVRSKTRRLLGENQLADEDVFSAREDLPNDPSILCRYSEVLLNNGETQRGMVEVRKAVAVSDRHFDAVMCLAVALTVGREVSQCEEALRLFAEVAGHPDPLPAGVREDAAWRALQLVQEIKTFLPAADFLSQIPGGVISAVAAGAFRSKLAFLHDDKEEAFRQADSAIASLLESTTKSDVRVLATLLTDLGRHNDALKLWQRIADYSSLNIDTRHLLDCATRLAKHDVILQACEQLREGGVDDPDLIAHEAVVRRHYEPDRAIELLQEYLSRHADAKNIRLQLFTYAIELGKEDLISADRALLPEPEDIPPSQWPLIVVVLLAGGNGEAALEYAYKLLRNHFSEASAHQAYVNALLPVETAGTPKIDAFDEVRPGAAVCYVEADGTQEEWRVIEDVYEADERLNEISPDHFLGHQLMGKKVGDTFLLAVPGVVRRTGVVRQIVSKYVFRYQDCTNSFQVRFPEGASFEMVRLPTVSSGTKQELDFRPILAAVDIKEQVIEGALYRYSSSNLPVNALAVALGENAFVIMHGLAGRPDVKIKCCSGNAAEHSEAMNALRVSDGIILDLTAIATLSLIGLLDIIKEHKKSLIVSRGTLLELEQLETKVRRGARAAGTLGKHGSRYVLTEETAEDRAERIRQVAEVVNSIKSSCTIQACLELAHLDPERRDRLVQSFGQHGAESLVLASIPGRTLWTDDVIVAHAAQMEFGVRRVWTQVVLQDWAKTDEFATEKFFQASAKLIGWGYYFTSLHLPILLTARRISNGDPDRWPFKQALEAFSDELVSARNVFNLVMLFLVEIFKEDILVGQEAILVRVLDRIADRQDGIMVIRVLQRLLPTAMGLNVMRAKTAELIITRWLSDHS